MITSPKTPRIPTNGGWFTSNGKMVGPGGIQPEPISCGSPDQDEFSPKPGSQGGRGTTSEGPSFFGRVKNRNSQPGRLQSLVRERFQEVFDRMVSQKLGTGSSHNTASPMRLAAGARAIRGGVEGLATRENEEGPEVEYDPDALEGDLEL